MKPIQLREADFKREVAVFTYPETMKAEFIEYWTEPNKSGTKMRFELEKTWHLARRLSRWANNGFNKETVKKAVMAQQVKKEPVTDIERVDALLLKYKKHPTDVPFADFGKWYDLLKSERLLRPFTQAEVDHLRDVYENDNSKCRCACVQMTFDGYCKTDLLFSNILEARRRLNG